MQQQYHDVPATAIPSMHRRQFHSKQRFVTELSQRLFEFVIQLLPTQEEMAVKEDVRKLLERLIRTIEPDSRLLSFGSTANGFSLRNSGERAYLLDTEMNPFTKASRRYGPLLSYWLWRTPLSDRSGNDVGRPAWTWSVMLLGFSTFLIRRSFRFLPRDEISRQTLTPCSHTDREVISRSISRPSSRDCLWYWFRK